MIHLNTVIKVRMKYQRLLKSRLHDLPDSMVGRKPWNAERKKRGRNEICCTDLIWVKCAKVQITFKTLGLTAFRSYCRSLSVSSQSTCLQTDYCPTMASKSAIIKGIIYDEENRTCYHINHRQTMLQNYKLIIYPHI